MVGEKEKLNVFLAKYFICSPDHLEHLHGDGAGMLPAGGPQGRGQGSGSLTGTRPSSMSGLAEAKGSAGVLTEGGKGKVKPSKAKGKKGDSGQSVKGKGLESKRSTKVAKSVKK